MATEEEKARNKRLREEAMQAKFARETKQTSNAKEMSPEQATATVAQSFGGLTGGAAKALMGRKQKIDDALKDAD